MQSSLRIVNVFLASPGDLKEERRLAKCAVDELNKGIAAHLGFTVQLKAWEDTLPGTGRPQAIINEELALCELFIGMMWKRWGTPPDSESKYTSGFQEEYEFALDKYHQTGKPEMAIYFKKIPEDLKLDPGKELAQVTSFRKHLESKRELLFREFNEPIDFERCVREIITSYLTKLDNCDAQEDVKEKSQLKRKLTSPGINTDSQPRSEHFSLEADSFLRDFLKRPKSKEAISKRFIRGFKISATSKLHFRRRK
jgi:hypothetical protein